MAHIVIVGAGIGGMPAAYEMRSKLAPQYKVTAIAQITLSLGLPCPRQAGSTGRQRFIFSSRSSS